MKASTKSTKKKLPSWAKSLIGSVAFLVVIVGGCNWKIDADLAKAKANARIAGLPITTQELRQLLPKPIDSENAQGVFVTATFMKPGNSPAEIEARKLVNKDTLTEADIAKLESLSPRLKAISSLAAELDGKTAVDFKREWEQGIFVKFPEYASAKGLVQMLGVSAKLKAARGDRIGALKDIKWGFKAGQMIGTEPTIIAMLVMIACEAIAISVLPFIVGNAPLSKTELKIVAEMREILGEPKPLSYWLITEPPMTINTIENIDSKDLFNPKLYTSPDFMQGIYFSSPLRKSSLSDYLDTITPMYQAVSDPSITPRQMGARAKELDRKADDWGVFGFNKKVSAIFLPIFGQAGQAKIKQTVIRTLLDKLLGKSAEIDAFTDLPLKKKVLETGIMYYSVGPNLKDDNGPSYDKTGKRVSENDDIGIIIPMGN